MADTVSKIKRSRLAIFLNTGTRETPKWSICGKGFTEQVIDYGAEVTKEQYVDEDSASNSVTSYSPTIPSPMTAHKGESVFGFVDGIRRARKVLDEAETDCLIVYLYEDGDAGAYAAEKNRCAVKVNSFGGPANEPVKLDFDILLSGDPEVGTFNPSTKTFTPKAA